MNRRKLLLDISRTHLLAKVKQTIVAALGVTFGIAMFVILISFMTGLNGLLDGLVLNRTPHIQLFNKSQASKTQPIDLWKPDQLHIVRSVKPKERLERIHNALPILQQLKNDQRIEGATAQTDCKVFYIAGTNNLNGLINGIQVNEEARLFQFDDYVVKGDVYSILKRKNAILLGAGVAKKLSLDVGDNISILSTNGTQYNLTIGGIYQSGLAEVDDIQSFVSLQTAQQILGVGNNYISRIHIKLKDINQAVSMGQTLEYLYNINALDIKEANAQFDTGSNIRNLITYVVSITLLIVAGFGIYNILNMFIYDKMNDIAILKATGFTGNDVMAIFLWQAMIIGVLGGVLGTVVGYGVSSYINTIPFETEALPTVETYPINFDPMFYVIAISFALIFTFLAGYLPARKAQKIDPVEVLRGQ